jgi:arylsulfatase A-like enzyme
MKMIGMGVAFWLGAAILGAAPARAEEAPRPNVVMILADDLGWGDVGWHGSEIKTPNLDRLAGSGAKLERFYVQPVCSPTRAAFLTGRYPMRTGLQVGVVRPWAPYGLPPDERTLPQALKEAGYDTAIVGKWHLGHVSPEYLPTRRGFDRQYGHYNGAIDYFTHDRDGGHDWHRDDRESRDEGYSTHLIAKEAARLIAERNPARPLFLYVPFNAVHAPHQVPARYKAPYRDLPEPRRSYAGMTAALDEAVGTIAEAVDAAGLSESTLIVFSSDNAVRGGDARRRVRDLARPHPGGDDGRRPAARRRPVPDAPEARRRPARPAEAARRPRRLGGHRRGGPAPPRRDPAELHAGRGGDPRRRLEADPRPPRGRRRESPHAPLQPGRRPERGARPRRRSPGEGRRVEGPLRGPGRRGRPPQGQRQHRARRLPRPARLGPAGLSRPGFVRRRGAGQFTPQVH